jgi:hypothetical protein
MANLCISCPVHAGIISFNTPNSSFILERLRLSIKLCAVLRAILRVAAVFPDPAGAEDEAFRLLLAGTTGAEEEEEDTEDDFEFGVMAVGAGASIGCDFRLLDADVSVPSRGFI